MSPHDLRGRMDWERQVRTDDRRVVVTSNLRLRRKLMIGEEHHLFQDDPERLQT